MISREGMDSIEFYLGLLKDPRTEPEDEKEAKSALIRRVPQLISAIRELQGEITKKDEELRQADKQNTEKGEKIDELYGNRNLLQGDYEDLQAEKITLQSRLDLHIGKVQGMREGLEFYANKENYKYEHRSLADRTAVAIDKGKRATEALQEKPDGK